MCRLAEFYDAATGSPSLIYVNSVGRTPWDCGGGATTLFTFGLFDASALAGAMPLSTAFCSLALEQGLTPGPANAPNRRGTVCDNVTTVLDRFAARGNLIAAMGRESQRIGIDHYDGHGANAFILGTKDLAR